MKKDSFPLVIGLCIFLTIPHSAVTDSARAAQCVAKACIDVYTQDGQIIIEGKKGSGPMGQPSPAKPTTKVVRPKPKVPKPKTPNPTTAPTKVSAPKKIKSPPTIRKAVKKKVTPKVSLSDRLVKLLPIAKISRQPRERALIKVPMIFWCDLPTQFIAKVPIVGEVIDVAMRPSFIWSFGDGSFFATTSSGAPYPQGGISHTYRTPGRYVVLLVATWGGSWTFDGVTRAITGEVRQTTLTTIDVGSAPTVLTR